MPTHLASETAARLLDVYASLDDVTDSRLSVRLSDHSADAALRLELLEAAASAAALALATAADAAA